MERIRFAARIYARDGAEYTGYAEIVVGSDVPKNRLMRLAMLALGATPWALVIVIVGVPK